MRFLEERTLKFDIICLIAFIVLGFICFTNFVVLPVKIILFGLSILTLIYFGIYRNHNYTEEAFKNQGKLDIDKGRTVSNLDVSEQTVPEDMKGVED